MTHSHIKYTFIFKLRMYNDMGETLSPLRLIRLEGLFDPWTRKSNYDEIRNAAIEALLNDDLERFKETPTEFPPDYTNNRDDYEMIGHIRGWPTFHPIHVADRVTTFERN